MSNRSAFLRIYHSVHDEDRWIQPLIISRQHPRRIYTPRWIPWVWKRIAQTRMKLLLLRKGKKEEVEVVTLVAVLTFSEGKPMVQIVTIVK